MVKATSLLDALRGDPQAVAIYCTDGGPRLTYGQLKSQVVSVAIALRKGGIRPGDAISIADTNTVLLHHGCVDLDLCSAVCTPWATQLLLIYQNTFIGAAGRLRDSIPGRHICPGSCCTTELELHFGKGPSLPNKYSINYCVIAKLEWTSNMDAVA